MSHWLLVPIWWRFKSARTLRSKNKSSPIQKHLKTLPAYSKLRMPVLKFEFRANFWPISGQKSETTVIFQMFKFNKNKNLESFPVSPFEFNICFWFCFISNIVFKLMFVSIVRMLFGVRPSSIRRNVLVRDLSLRILNWVTRLERT